MFSKLYDYIKKYIKENYKYLVFLLAVILLFTIQLPFSIFMPGGSINLQDRIVVDGGKKSSGKFEMAYVSVMRGSLPMLGLSYIIPNWDIVKDDDYKIKGESMEDTMKVEKMEMDIAKKAATYVAYKKAGKDISNYQEFMDVIFIHENADTDLKIGDQIQTIDGKIMNKMDEMVEYIGSIKLGDKVTIKVKRDGYDKTCYAIVKSIDNKNKIGISAINDVSFETDPKIEIKSKNRESGPSGGQMMALAIYNTLIDEDITKGKTIIGTGTIDLAGNIGEIDGVKYKILGAENNHAEIFLCPKENESEALKVKEENNLKIKVKGVATFDEALEYLKTL
jgi:PDZ domain-containing protein